MKYLFVTWDGGGNLSPVLVLARQLVDRGHEIRFLGHRSQEGAITAAGCSFRAYEHAPDSDASRPETSLIQDWRGGSPPQLFASMRANLMFGPAADFAADVLAELDRYPADALAVDFLLFGGLAAAERSGLPAAALWHSVYSIPTLQVPPFGPGFGLPRGWPGRLRDRVFRKLGFGMWNKGLDDLNRVRSSVGLAPLPTVFEQFDRLDRTLVMASAAFDFAAVADVPLPANVRYVGPQVELGPISSGDDDEQPLVLASFSTTYQAQQDLLRRVVAALGQLPVHAVVTTGPAIAMPDRAPSNVEVLPWASHAKILSRAALTVTHGGLGTVSASLAHGVPVICLPMGRDQLDVAARVRHAGAGTRLPSKASESAIATAVDNALSDSDLRDRARHLAGRMREEIADALAVAELERLGGSPRAPTTPQEGRLGRQ